MTRPRLTAAQRRVLEAVQNAVDAYLREIVKADASSRTWSGCRRKGWIINQPFHWWISREGRAALTGR